MSLLEAIFLGVVQGLTEFLPISSSGHLVLFQRLFGLEEGALTFDVLLHFGTLIAVFAVYWRDIVEIVKNPFGKMARLILVGAIPTAAIGLLFKDLFDELFASGATLGAEFVITGVIIWWADSARRGSKGVREMGYGDAMLIGTLQGAAILPAISRSGLTIMGALFRGLDREFAAKYSFLVSIPVILGANLMEIKDIVTGEVANAGTFGMNELLGTLAAAVAGYFAIKYMIRLIVKKGMRMFAWYVWVLGGLILFDQIVTKVYFHF
ncbi:undecaprenyl-diphosphate phosphatase [Tumebacillus sp. ITR2]|uniref:Undecaprenyl-diphosphatase n=1 Tax=Tumebacillus amylolyticus TaxID=2801339 RepID=A0ABS1JE99_9BACL|nr:undecaprenyl-diphosphate phosphatase [Tumebacillus amylolyticus]MBL0388530.1 undecaprenyl-diphosphate phosphatase [Tumebacillus amylolyticus]